MILRCFSELHVKARGSSKIPDLHVSLPAWLKVCAQGLCSRFMLKVYAQGLCSVTLYSEFPEFSEFSKISFFG